MKYQQVKITVMSLLILASFQLSAQDTPVDTTIVMDPAMFVPADSGYYLAGVDKVDDNGITQHYDKCEDAYGDSDHRESGTQNGWEYNSVIIFSKCNTDPAVVDDAVKGTPPEENWPTEGNMIQVTKHKYALTDSASYGYLTSPAFTNISSLTVKVSTDVSINNSRTIWMLIEASLDGGETWEYIDNLEGTAYVYQQLTNQGGDIHVYTAGSNEGFDDIISASQAGAIQLRFMPIPLEYSTGNGERLKFWEITIEAQTVAQATGNVLSSAQKLSDEFFTIDNGEFIALSNNELRVYNLSGVLIGSGSRVPVCRSGLFIVKTTNGDTSKIFLK